MVGEIRGTMIAILVRAAAAVAATLSRDYRPPPTTVSAPLSAIARPQDGGRRDSRTLSLTPTCTNTHNPVRTELPPHRVVRVHVSVFDRPEHVLVTVAPEVLLLHDDVHEMLLGERRGLAAPVAVEYAEERVLQVLVVRRRLERHAEHVLHVLASTLIAVAGHPQVNPDAERHLDARRPTAQ